MKYLPPVAGALLGFVFVFFGTAYFLNILPAPPKPPEGSAPALFMGALYPSGYLSFVKALEILGGLLVAIPRTRNFGLLILGPIIVNILAFAIFIMKGDGIFAPPVVAVSVLAAYLLFVERKAFAQLCRPASLR
ncbi:MAG: DoxX family protein [Verrucomicrobiota bacterium]|nr:DoxX family protein [Verrucomicrobiota bacterium]